MLTDGRMTDMWSEKFTWALSSVSDLKSLTSNKTEGGNITYWSRTGFWVDTKLHVYNKSLYASKLLCILYTCMA